MPPNARRACRPPPTPLSPPPTQVLKEEMLAVTKMTALEIHGSEADVAALKADPAIASMVTAWFVVQSTASKP